MFDDFLKFLRGLGKKKKNELKRIIVEAIKEANN